MTPSSSTIKIRFVAMFLATTLATMGNTAFSAEPLRGPVAGNSWWLSRKNAPESGISDRDNIQTDISKERFLNLDVPVPLALWSAMPFLTVRHLDQSGPTPPRYLVDQRIGVGLLHHAAEGDPAWRLDAARVGSMSSKPYLWGRFIINLVKPYPWLKLRPSDQVLSWIGISGTQRTQKKSLIVPELAWIRRGRDGLVIDLTAPRHFVIGYRGSQFGLETAAEQDWLILSGTSATDSSPKWTPRRQGRLRLLANIGEELLATASLLYRPSTETMTAARGAEITLEWTPRL